MFILTDTTISERDPRWVGAWWIGFIAFGAGAILISVPICCFPASLKKKQNDEEPTKCANSEVSEKKPTRWQTIKGYYRLNNYFYDCINTDIKHSSEILQRMLFFNSMPLTVRQTCY